jgi:hypothetical protein
VQAYLRFAKLKRDQHVRETLTVISEFQEDRIRKGVRRSAILRTPRAHTQQAHARCDLIAPPLLVEPDQGGGVRAHARVLNTRTRTRIRM